MRNIFLILKNNPNKVGYIQFGFNKHIGYITNLKINKQFRGNGYGTELLKMSESTLKNYNVDKIKLCSWNSIYSNDNNLSFFYKNGYTSDLKPIYFDNDDDIFEIYEFVKKIL